jgi:hypothetical protein
VDYGRRALTRTPGASPPVPIGRTGGGLPGTLPDGKKGQERGALIDTPEVQRAIVEAGTSRAASDADHRGLDQFVVASTDQTSPGGFCRHRCRNRALTVSKWQTAHGYWRSGAMAGPTSSERTTARARCRSPDHGAVGEPCAAAQKGFDRAVGLEPGTQRGVRAVHK